MIEKLHNVRRYAKLLYSQQLITEVSKMLKTHRLRQNLSHEKVADMAAMHRTAIGHIENGTRRPSLYAFIKMAKALKLKPSELLREAEKNLQDDSAGAALTPSLIPATIPSKPS